MCIISFGYLGAYYQVSTKSAREFDELSALKEAGASYLIWASYAIRRDVRDTK